ncbi:uncharacterized protein LOC143435228 isoform X1 [Arvicanthis niloticus]|uniref:uncharacterized protein LOC143309518 isoform X1 n=1 Tax=Arvicanthis niloticus TaxID=61156 RepID=UPI00402B31B5
MVKQEGDQAPQLTNVTQLVTGVNKTLINQTDFLPIPVCVYPPFLFILSNNSFIDCTNKTCEMSPCWNTRWASQAMVARVPRWIPVPVETPSTLSLFRQKRDFGITATIVTAISLAAVAATTAGFAMATTVQTSTTLNQLSATVAEAMNTHASATAQFKGNWSEGFEETMESLRAAIVTINLTRVDLSLTEGFSFWISSAFSFFKEWAGVVLFGTALCCGLVFMLWLVCK